jgi:hypothetical protein
VKSKKKIEKESSIYLGYNPPLRKSMKRYGGIGIIGLCFLLLGFFLQIVALLI